MIIKIIKFIYTRICWAIYRFLFSINGKIVNGKNLKISGPLFFTLKKKSSIDIGNNLSITSGLFYNPLSRGGKSVIYIEDFGKLKIGNNVGLSSVCIWVHSALTIGDNVKIGADTLLLDSNAHSTNYIERRDNYSDQLNKKKSSIIIEEDVFIGARCIILKGVTIGARSIISAGSVVKHSIPCDSIAEGNPCRVTLKK